MIKIKVLTVYSKKTVQVVKVERWENQSGGRLETFSGQLFRYISATFSLLDFPVQQVVALHLFQCLLLWFQP